LKYKASPDSFFTSAPVYIQILEVAHVKNRLYRKKNARSVTKMANND